MSLHVLNTDKILSLKNFQWKLWGNYGANSSVFANPFYKHDMNNNIT